MLLHPAALKHHAAATNRGRYALNAIALMPNGLLSTDGHGLLYVPYPDLKPAEAPKIEGVDAAAPAPVVEPFLLALDDAAKVSALVGRKGRNLPPITQLVQAQIDGDGIACGATDLGTSQVIRLRRMEGAYPQVERVIPDYSNALTVSVNIDQIIRALKALKGVTSDDVVTLRVIDDQTAIGLSCKDGVCALCMPIQVEKPEDHVPDRLVRLRTPEQGPPVAAPAEPEDEGAKIEDFVVPTETEMQEAQEAFDEQAVVPELASTPAEARPKRRRRRKQAANAQDELQAILSGV